MSKEAREYPVFRDDLGNRFVFPELYNYEWPDGRTREVSWSRCRAICFALKITEEHFKLFAAPDGKGNVIIPHVLAEGHSPGFAHGGSEVWMIGGPIWNEILAETGVLLL